MRILHLIDPASPGGGPCTLRLAAELLARLPGAHHDVVIIGNSGHLELARGCGLAPLGRLAPALNRPALGRGGFRRLLRSYERAWGVYDVIHAWTCSAARVLPGGANVVVESVGPAVDGHAVNLDERALLRARWGADGTTFVVALLGEPAARADGPFAVDTAVRVALTSRALKIVCHHSAMLWRGLRRWLGRLEVENLVVADDEVAEPWRVVAGLDAALYAARPQRRPAARPLFAAREAGPPRWLAWALETLPGGAGLDEEQQPGVAPLVWAMAAGVPVIAQSTDDTRNLVRHDDNGLLFAGGDINGASAALVALHDDAERARRLGAAGRELVDRRFRPADAAARLGAMYGIRAAVPGVAGAERSVPQRLATGARR